MDTDTEVGTMKRILFLCIMILFIISQASAIQDGEFIYGSQHWHTYTSSGSSVNFYPDPMPDPFVRICATSWEGYAGIYQQELEQGQGKTRAIFHLKSVSAGLNALVTVGWTDIDGDFGSYYKEVTSAGTYTVDCNNTNFPFVTVQGDSSHVINAIVEVDEIEVINPSATPTPTPTPVSRQTVIDYILDEGGESHDINDDGKIDVADVIFLMK